MLTRLKVSGFKNLVDVDIQFGPLTCIAGANGVGKSNLFDAITFLSALADKPLIDAALSVRDESSRMADVRGLFHRIEDQYEREMSFEAEMIIPKQGWDDLGQEAAASITFLAYKLRLAYKPGEGIRTLGGLEIIEETLTHITRGDAHDHLAFPHSAKEWRESAVVGRRSGNAFISTTDQPGEARKIMLHQDGGSGRPRSALAATLPRTVLSATNAAESPTALLARNEMRSWRLLQLEPSALRAPDPFTAPTHLGIDGSHLPATLFRLASGPPLHDATASSERVYARIANRLAELIADVQSVHIERDDTRELLTVYLSDLHGASHPARALSDGTLRFLALATLELDPEASGVLCLEEPENGIHPGRIPAMLRLLSDLAVDVYEPVGPENPLRQIIINTHSPAVVSQIDDENLVIAEPAPGIYNDRLTIGVRFSWLPDTWRAKANPDPRQTVARGVLLTYLNPTIPSRTREGAGAHPHDSSEAEHRPRHRRVVDRPDIQPYLWPPETLKSSGAHGE